MIGMRAYVTGREAGNEQGKVGLRRKPVPGLETGNELLYGQGHKRGAAAGVEAEPVTPAVVRLCKYAAAICLLVTGAHAETLSLSDAVRTGLANNYGIRVARNDADAAGNTRMLKTGYLLPMVTATGGITYTDAEYDAPMAAQSGTDQSYSAGASLGWTLFDGFRMFHARDLVEGQALLGEAGARQKIESGVVAIISAYCGLAGALQLEDAARQQLAASRAQLERVRARTELGQATARVLLAQQVTVNADSAALAARVLDRVTAVHTLNAALGREPDRDVTVVTDLEPPAPEHDAAWWTEQALDHNAGLRMADISRNMAASNRGIARAAFWPVLSASGSYTQTWNDPDNTRLAAGVSVSVPLLSGFSRIVNAKNAQLEAENATLEYEEARNELRAYVYQQWARFGDAHGQVGFGREAVGLAEQSLALTEEQYRLGQVTDLAFRDAQLALLNARVRLASAVYRSVVLEAQLRQLGGVLLIK